MDMAFGVLTAREPQEVVTQLVDSLGQRDSIFVHHDYSQQPAFEVAREGVRLIPDFIRTGWGEPSLARAILHLIRTALASSNFDYFQLLSGSCLPLQPVSALKSHLARARSPILADLVNLDTDERALMSHGHRVFCRSQKLAARLLRRSRRWYFGESPVTIQQSNLGIHERLAPSAELTPMQWLGKQIHVAARVGLLDSHPFHGDMTPYIGSLWFCLRRDVCEYLVRQEERNPSVPYLMDLKVCDEVLFPTLLGNSSFGIAPSNHLVNRFTGAHPRTFEAADLPTLAGSEQFFGRKFAMDAMDPCRQAVIDLLIDRVDKHRSPAGYVPLPEPFQPAGLAPGADRQGGVVGTLTIDR